jgi:hypothetical protein
MTAAREKPGEGEAPKFHSTDLWTCPFCRQSVRVGAYGCCAPPDFFKKCLLRDHMVGGECVAYLNPRKARELMKGRE